MNGENERHILVLAPYCDGTDISEAWSTFQWVNRLSKRYKLTLLTYNKRNRPAAAPQLPHMKVVEWRDWPIVGRFEILNTQVRLAYIGFYFNARQWLKRHLRDHRYDMIHQLSPLALRYPSPAVDLGIPLVIGPLAGSVPTPTGFRDEMRGEPWFRRLRALDAWRFRHDRSLRRTYEQADLVIGVAPYVRSILNGLKIRRFEVVNETAVSAVPDIFQAPGAEPRNEAPGSAIRLIFVGRVTRSKGARDAIRAMAQLGDCPSVVLDVVGDGDDLQACRRETAILGLSDRVFFHGWQPRAQIDAFYRRADILIFPSFREPSGNVVLEGMAHGLALIVADNGGPAHTVDDTCGIRVSPRAPEQYAKDLASAVRCLVLDRARLKKMKIAAKTRIQSTFLWDHNVERMSLLYESILRKHAGNYLGCKLMLTRK